MTRRSGGTTSRKAWAPNAPAATARKAERAPSPRKWRALRLPRPGSPPEEPSSGSPADSPSGRPAEAVERVVEQRPTLAGGVLAAEDGDDHPVIVAHRRPHQATPGIVGEAWLHAVGAWIHAQQAIE